MIHRHRFEIKLREGLAEIPGPDAGHAEAGHGLHFVEAQLEHLFEGQRVDVGVVGAGAVPGHEQRLGLVQVMHHGRVPVEEHARHRLGRLVRELVRVAITVDEGVPRPVGRRDAWQGGLVGLALEVAVEPVDELVAPVDVERRVDEYDRVLADAPDHRLLGDRQAVGQLEHGLRRSGFVRVHAGIQVIDRPRGGDQPFGRCRIGQAWIGQRGRGRAQPVELRDAMLVGDRHHDDIAPFLRAADREETHARRSVGERAAVSRRGLRVDEFSGCAGDAMQESAWRRHGRRCGQVADPRRQEARLGRGLRYLLDGARLGNIRPGIDSCRQRCRSRGKQRP